MSEKEPKKDDDFLSDLSEEDQEIAKEIMKLREPASQELKDRVEEVTKPEEKKRKSLFRRLRERFGKNLH